SQLADREARAGDILPGEHGHDVRDRVDPIAPDEREREQGEQCAAQRGDRHAGAARGAAAGGTDDGGAHARTPVRVRTTQMNTGAPSSAVMIPTSISCGRATTRPTVSARVSSAAP